MASTKAGLVSLHDSVAVIQAILESFLDIARFLRAGVDSSDLRIFYADLMAYSLLCSNHLGRITRIGSSLTQTLIDSMTGRLEAVVTTNKACAQNHLQLFHTQWHRIRTESTLEKSHFIDGTLDFGKTNAQRMDFVNFLATWAGDLEAQYPEDRSIGMWTLEDVTPQTSGKKIDDPSFVVGNAAQAAFKALVACQNCGCMPQHDFGARLCLGTYRKPITDADLGDIDFNMFICMEEAWKEVCVHTVRDRVIQFDIPGQPMAAVKRPAPSAPVKQLCASIARAKRTMKVELKVMRGRLFKLQSLRSSHTFDLAKSAVSLEDFLHDGPRAFTDKTKRILAVLLSYTVMHLQDTPWLQSSWDSSDILFFRTKSSEVPLQPFLRTRFPASAGSGKEDLNIQHHDGHELYNDSEEEFDPDDLPPHACPTLVTLAVILMEIYFVTTFDLLARRLNIEIEDDASGSARYLDASMVFNACRDEIPENVQLLYAVEKCLDSATWEDEDGNRMETQDLNLKIYQEVVQPLESDLSLAYSSISINDLDRFAQTLDFGSWNQVIRTSELQSRDYSYPVQLEPHERTPSPLSSLPSPLRRIASPAGSLNASASLEPLFSRHLSVQQLASPTQSQLELGVCQASGSTVEASGADYKASQFFDDASPSDGHSAEACTNYSSWKFRYQDVYEKLIRPHLDSGLPGPRVKIAILDTGIDLNHPDIQASADNIKAKRNWVRDGARAPVNDTDGHGTFVAGLIFDYAPDAEVYVAKIADSKPSSPRIISKAIMHAVDVWKVDIISMSFGFPTRNIDGYDELENSIKHAYFHDVLLFAAASNSGAQLGRAYPAREANVVCVHSTDVYGNRSPFSPTAVPEDINLATVGQAVESACSVRTAEGAGETYSTVKSGTSYATPIMAGIAAFLMLYTSIHLPEEAQLLRNRRRMMSLLQRISQKGRAGGSRDGYHFVDVSLYSDSLFGKDKTYIDQTFIDILRD